MFLRNLRGGREEGRIGHSHSMNQASILCAGGKPVGPRKTKRRKETFTGITLTSGESRVCQQQSLQPTRGASEAARSEAAPNSRRPLRGSRQGTYAEKNSIMLNRRGTGPMDLQHHKQIHRPNGKLVITLTLSDMFPA